MTPVESLAFYVVIVTVTLAIVATILACITLATILWEDGKRIAAVATSALGLAIAVGSTIATVAAIP